MRRTIMFVVMVGTALLALALVVAWYLLSYQPGGGSFGGVMGQMMGSYGTYGMTAMPGWVWGTIVMLVGLAVVGLVGFCYYLAYPEIRPNPLPQPTAPGPESTGPPGMSWAVLLRTSKPEEKRILEVLAAHSGSYLQKFVVKEAGLSRLKTHRIVSRLAERGIIGVERSGNTNQLSLAPWVRGEATKSAPGT